ncbi:MAG: 6-bladed beta-propeller [Balneolales bacterium]
MKFVQMVVMIITLAACSSQDDTMTSLSENLPDTTSISFNIVTAVTHADENYFSGFREVMLTSNHDLVIQDGRKQILLWFDSDGNFIGTIGREGRGPGEFTDIRHVLMAPGDTLHVFDRNNARHQIFAIRDENWTQVRETPLRMDFSEEMNSYFPSDVYLMDGELIGRFRNNIGIRDTTTMYHQWFSHINTDMKPVNGEKHMLQPLQEAVVIRENSSVVTIYFSESFQLFTQIEPGTNLIHTVRNDDAVIRMFDIEGNELRTISLPREVVPIDESSQKEYLSQLRQFYDNNTARLAESKYLPHQPFVKQFILDDRGRYWVMINRKDKSKPNWFVVDQEGHMLGGFRMDLDGINEDAFQLSAVQGNRLYAHSLKEDEPILLVIDAEFD